MAEMTKTSSLLNGYVFSRSHGPQFSAFFVHIPWENYLNKELKVDNGYSKNMKI